MKNIVSFKTIDQCVDYIVRAGFSWDFEQEMKLVDKHSFDMGHTLVMFDPYEILSN